MKKIQLVLRWYLYFFENFCLRSFPSFLFLGHIISPTFPLYTTLSAHIIQSQGTIFEMRSHYYTCLLFSRSLRKPTPKETGNG